VCRHKRVVSYYRLSGYAAARGGAAYRRTLPLYGGSGGPHGFDQAQWVEDESVPGLERKR
jgi:hypothetical protein